MEGTAGAKICRQEGAWCASGAVGLAKTLIKGLMGLTMRTEHVVGMKESKVERWEVCDQRGSMVRSLGLF